MDLDQSRAEVHAIMNQSQKYKRRCSKKCDHSMKINDDGLDCQQGSSSMKTTADSVFFEDSSVAIGGMTESGIPQSNSESKRRKKQNGVQNLLENKGKDCDRPEGSSLLNVTPPEIDPSLQLPVKSCLKLEGEMAQSCMEVSCSQVKIKRREQNKKCSASEINDRECDLQESGTDVKLVEKDDNSVLQLSKMKTNAKDNSVILGEEIKFVKSANTVLMEKHDDDLNNKHESLDEKNLKTYKRKSVIKSSRRSEKSSASFSNSSESIEDGMGPLFHCSDEEVPTAGLLEKSDGELLGEHATPAQVVDDVLMEEASFNCADGEPASRDCKVTSEMKTFEKNFCELSFVNDVSVPDKLKEHLEQNRIAMSDYLPEEVVLEILHRVPVKSLIRFRCVSKSWNSLITNPNFINSHLTQSLSLSPNSNKLIVRHCTSRPNIEHYKLFHDNNDSSFEQIQQLEFPLTTRRIHHFMLVGYVNGLFSFHEQDRFILWNPSVRKFITLPKPRISAKTHGHVSTHLALGFDPKTNDYKVVSLAFPCNSHRLPEIPMVEVYSLSQGSWRITNAGDSFPPWTSFNNYLVPEASLNGAVHFAAHHGNTLSPLVLSFDLSDEAFRVISVPNGAFSGRDDVHTSVIGGLLSLLCHDAHKDTVNKRCSIWVMKEYDIVDSWTKLFTVDLNGEIVRVLGLQKNGHILVHTNVPGDWELSLYDPESQQVKKLGICGRQYYFCVDNYMENLVLLDKPNDVVSRRGRKRKCRVTADKERDKERVRMLQEVRCMLQKTIQHEEKFRHLQESMLHQETILLPVQEAVQHQQETILQQHMEEMLKSGLEEADTVKSRLLVLIQQLSGQAGHTFSGAADQSSTQVQQRSSFVGQEM